MPSVDQFAAALEDLRRSQAAGRLAHAYLVHGPVRGAALTLAEALLQFLFCPADRPPCGVCAECRRVAAHAHPDILWLEPESKTRQIIIGENDAEGIRQVIRFIALTPFSGQRKAAVLLDAERMNPAAANAFLKTLEEPPPNSLILLLSEAPQALLPTITSRCQKIDLSAAPAAPGAWLEPLSAWLRGSRATDPLGAAARASRLREILAAEKQRLEAAERADPGFAALEEEVRDARLSAQYRRVRDAIFRCILQWHRDVLLRTLQLDEAPYRFPAEAAAQQRQAQALDPAAALADVRRIETLIRRLDQLPAASEPALLEMGLRMDSAGRR